MSLSFQTMAAVRFGYGLRPGETMPADKRAMLEQIRAGADAAPLFPIGGLAARRTAIGDMADRLQAIRKGTEPDNVKRAQEKAIYQQLEDSFQRDADARIAQAVFSPNGFYERLASFWVNHFSVSVQKSEQMRLLVPLFETEAIRPNIGAPFPVLLKAVTRHPAMLIYLDQAQSLGPDSPAGLKQKKGLNENLARELMELHTLGAGSGYTQDDVRSAAMVLTGIAIDRQAATTDFRPGIAEPGSHMVLSTAYGGKPRRESDYLAMLDDLALHPKTAQHICRKLVAHFIADQPPQAMVDVMADCWKNTNGDLTAVYGTMLDHPLAWSGEGAKARSPFDFVVAGLRALNVPQNPLAGRVTFWAAAVGDAGMSAAAHTPGDGMAAAGRQTTAPMAGAPAASETTAASANSAAGTSTPGTIGTSPPAIPPLGAAAQASVAPGPADATGSAAMSGAGSMVDGRTGGMPATMSPGGDMSADADADALRRKQQQAAVEASLYVPRGLGLYALRRMGEPVWQPPSPAGFPDNFDAWINASALSERLAWSRRAIGRYGKQNDPRQFLKETLADAARDDTIRVVSQAPNRTTGLTLVLASPDFNRR